MSVLDKLAVMFEVKGTAEVKKGTDSVTKGMNDSEAAMGSSIAALKNYATQLTAVLAPLKAFSAAVHVAMDFGAQGNDLRMLAQQAGVSTDSLQVMGNALKNYGGNAASASAVMGGLNKNIQQMRLGQGGALQDAAFRYGIDVSGSGEGGLATSEEMLENISERMKSLNEQEQIDLGQSIGLDAPTIALMQGKYETLAEAKDRAAKMRVFTPEEIAQSKKYNDAMIKMNDSFDKMKSIIGRALLPAITWISDALAKGNAFWDEHRTIATAALTAIGIVLAGFAIAGVVALAPLIASFASLAAGVIVAAAPFILLVAIIAAISAAIKLVVDDFKVFQEGGVSVIGTVVDYWRDEINIIVDFWTNAWKKLKGFFGFDDDEDENPESSEKTESVSRRASMQKDIDAGAAALSATQNPLSAITSGSIYNNSATNSVGNASLSIGQINIKTAATDANAIASDIGLQMSSEWTRIQTQQQNGVAF